MTRYSKQALLAAVSFLFLGTATTMHPADAASNEEALKAQQIVAEAQDTVLTVKGSPQGDAFRDALADASGVLIVPDFYKGGLIVGGATGEGVLMSRNADESWSEPAFFRLSSGSIGLQAGLKESELVLVILNDQALEKILQDKITLGAEGGIAVAKIGAGMGAGSTTDVDADVVAFSNSEGAFAGVSVEGSVLSIGETHNEAYYGQPVTTREILQGSASPRYDAGQLQQSL